MSETKLRITGMTCGHCVAAVTKALQAVPGVQRADVNLERKQAVVEGSVQPARLIDAVTAQGYAAEILS
ncbi:MAG TPA: cation transporter [Acidiferrobacteraceae bacterium]|nr:cation transporter [Acidiferrobacteraceae bacterium]